MSTKIISADEARALLEGTTPGPLEVVHLRGLSRGVEALTQSLIRTMAQRDEARAEVERFRAIIEGRTIAPTDEEIAAHAKHGGLWQYLSAGRLCHGWLDSLELLHGAPVSRWWPIDRDGRPCAWPEVVR